MPGHSLRPDDLAAARAKAQQILGLLNSGQAPEAEKLARHLVADFPRRSESNHLLARALAQQGKKAEARFYAQAAVKLSPEDAILLMFLGRLLCDLQFHELAQPHLQKAHKLNGDSLAVNWALADFHMATGSGHEARGYFERAISLDPEKNSNKELLADYARCLVAVGDLNSAEAVFGMLLDGRDHRIWALTQMALLRKTGADSDLGGTIRRELARSDLNDDKLSQLNFALARLEENSGNFGEAFRHLTKSRELLRMTFDSRRHNRAIDRMIGFYRRDLIASCSRYGDLSELPVFVVGMPRSGTTLTEQIMAAHGQARGLGELARMFKLESAFRDRLDSADPAEKIPSAAKHGYFKEKAGETLAYLRLLCPEGDRLVDKNPLNYLNLGYIHLCFPRAKIIYCKRHPADNFISAFQNQMNRKHDYCYDQRAYAACYRSHERLMAHWKSCFPENIFELQYEALVENFEVKARELIAFIGLPWDENCLNFSENKTTVKTFSSQQVRNKLYNSSVGRWKNYEKHLGPLFEVLNEG